MDYKLLSKALRDPEFYKDMAGGVRDVVGRGVVGGALGAPVDIANMAMGALGVPVSQTPVMGSEWLGKKLQQAGVVSDKRNPIGETIASLIDPATAGAGAAKLGALGASIAAPLAAMAIGSKASEGAKLPRLAEALPSQVGAIGVYHGSPHTFDKFDISKIGTGEGAQAYGHGLYFAESPEVAGQYARDLTDINGGPVVMSQSGLFPRARYGTVQDGIDSNTLLLDSLKEKAANGDEYAAKQIPVLEKKIADISNKSSLYEVSLRHPDPAKEAATPLSPDDFLQWDKPLSEQPQSVQSAWGDFTKNHPDYLNPDISGGQYRNPLGGNLYGAVFEESPGMGVGARSAVTDYLKQRGIPGIRYLDQGSRGSGAGTANYVVFDDKIPQVVSRNGKPIK